MKYYASYRIRDDYWSKHPFGVRVLGEDGSVLKEIYGLDDFEMCNYHLNKLRKEGYDIAEAVPSEFIDDAEWHRICLLATAKKPPRDEITVNKAAEGEEDSVKDTAEMLTSEETEPG